MMWSRGDKTGSRGEIGDFASTSRWWWGATVERETCAILGAFEKVITPTVDRPCFPHSDFEVRDREIFGCSRSVHDGYPCATDSVYAYQGSHRTLDRAAHGSK